MALKLYYWAPLHRSRQLLTLQGSCLECEEEVRVQAGQDKPASFLDKKPPSDLPP